MTEANAYMGYNDAVYKVRSSKSDGREGNALVGMSICLPLSISLSISLSLSLSVCVTLFSLSPQHLREKN